MKFENRIEQFPACEAVPLVKTEYPHYTGSGVRIVRVVGWHIAGMFNPAEVEYQEDTQAMADEALDAAIAWMANAEGELWFGFCSGYQLCEPRRITLTDAAALARLARMIGDEFNE